MSNEGTSDSKSFSEKYIEPVRLICLSIGISLILTPLITIAYPKIVRSSRIIQSLLKYNVSMNVSWIYVLSGMLDLGITLVVGFYWWKSVKELVSDPKGLLKVVNFVHIILALLFILVDFINIPTFVSTTEVTWFKVWMIFVFILFIVFTLLRILNAILKWLRKDQTSNSSIPRMTLLLTLIGTLIGLLLGK